ncbi:DUF2768 family protein [bacterium]|nr:DUF2768 family protein [bacterium]MBU1881244.1 DUF2768 family protein [bacterium]
MVTINTARTTLNQRIFHLISASAAFLLLLVATLIIR